MDHAAEFFAQVRAIPYGKVMSSKGVGSLARLTGRQAGQLLARGEWKSEKEIPWWRVVAWDGSLPVAKRDPVLALIQKQTLLAEGVLFVSEWRVDMKSALHVDPEG